MLTITIGKIGKHQTVNFAVDELRKYLKCIDKSVIVDVRAYDNYDKTVPGILWVGEDTSFEPELPAVADRTLDDGIIICVKDFCGYITGTNPRAALIAAYRFLRELGIRWVRPGGDGEIIPRKSLECCNVCIKETPQRRHRGICIEGAIAYEHVYNMIDWLPKVGMNAYFFQFIEPHNFFDRWYSHKENPYIPPVPYTYEDTKHVHRQLVDDVALRSLILHEVGHGWTCLPLGITGNPWDPENFKIPEEKFQFVALRNGKRQFRNGVPRWTQLCFSNPEVHDIMIAAVVNYLKENPHVDYLHFWLADGSNNYCECEECSKRLPSDYYVDIINELDEALTKERINTKIVFLSYSDLRYAPETARIKNPDRFTLMLAPSRTYSASYGEIDLDDLPAPPPYVRNNIPAITTEEAISLLAEWQKQFSGDSFVFDYNLMYDHYRDIGYAKVAKVLFDDVQNLDHIGINGRLSCQVSRCCFPTALPLYSMACGLWDRSCTFDDVQNEYYRAAFGKNGELAKQYLSSLSELVDPVFLRGQKKEWTDADFCTSAKQAVEQIRAFRPTIKEILASETDENVKQSWYYLDVHSVYAEHFALSYCYGYSGNGKKFKEHLDLAFDWMRQNEPNIHSVYDVYEGATAVVTKHCRRFNDALF